MGCVKNITAEQYPRQSDWRGKRVNVCFHYDTAHTFPGVIIRDDAEEPLVTIIALQDGRFVLGTECQYSLAD